MPDLRYHLTEGVLRLPLPSICDLTCFLPPGHEGDHQIPRRLKCPPSLTADLVEPPQLPPFPYFSCEGCGRLFHIKEQDAYRGHDCEDT